MLNYRYDSSLETLYFTVRGILTIQNIIDHYRKLPALDKPPANLKVCIDCRGVNFQVSFNEIRSISNEVKNALGQYDNIAEAIMVDEPYQTAIASIFKSNNKFDNYAFQIFSTESAAMQWLESRRF
jgi:hypothetical protein